MDSQYIHSGYIVNGYMEKPFTIKSMSKSLFALMASALLLALTGIAQSPAKKSALDKATLEAYIRHLYVMDSRIVVKISDPVPSEVAGFMDVSAHCAMGAQSQDFKFLISEDCSEILHARVFRV